MSSTKRKNIGHSVYQRLLNHAKTHGDDFNLLLFRYGVERLLYRLSISPFADIFILKGASLFLVWKGQNYRVTRDADLLGLGPVDAENIADIFKEICQAVSDDVDGIQFMPDTIRVAPIREEHEYGGIRVTLVGMLHHARIPLQIDIGWGDAVTPAPEKIDFPTILDAPKPHLLAYPRYTMVAEKLETMVRLGIANSRMKDFFDVWLLSRLFEFDGRTLCEAVRNTFQQRSTLLAAGLPMAFTEEFRKDTQKQTQWRAFIRKSKPKTEPGDLDTVISEISEFLLPAIKSLQRDEMLESAWAKGGPCWK
ncbi:MAG: nucleotidyl transferase AbiEii/AbiGii toxin family protein [Candidatus Euphemobacter frigidus]|nr:nucleotidyl transferase AbiEii/AbiGii toxin family protein [Candidatus Euphemobacter frigidus]MDP8275059.1 nucleotidyl transferase AbiEii/AbiGii toxin family protein [Candidatus Euphemobacter frigidus]